MIPFAVGVWNTTEIRKDVTISLKSIIIKLNMATDSVKMLLSSSLSLSVKLYAKHCAMTILEFMLTYVNSLTTGDSLDVYTENNLQCHLHWSPYGTKNQFFTNETIL